jgi:hypothetical protein
VSAAFIKIARRWASWGLIAALIWVTAQLPVPVLHAHASQPEAASQLALGHHLELCHVGRQQSGFIDWHVHWFSPQTMLECLGETDGDSDEGTHSHGELPSLGIEQLNSTEVMAWTASFSEACDVLPAAWKQILFQPRCHPSGKYPVCAWYCSPHNRLCQIQVWLC